jgi:hypothetical protein
VQSGLTAWRLGTNYASDSSSCGGWAYGEYAVWNRVLDAEEVAAEYASKAPLVDAGAFIAPIAGQYGIRVPMSYANVSNPPTDAELTAQFGAQPDGFASAIDDNAAATNCYLTLRASSAWWIFAGSKAT